MQYGRVAGLAGALTLAFGAAQGADLPVYKAPVPMAYSWAGPYAGFNIGAVKDRNDLGTVPLSFPAVGVSDLTGAATIFPTFLLVFPGSFPTPSAAAQSGANTSLIGGIQGGYNWQSGSIVYGLEGDIDALHSRQNVGAVTSLLIPGVAPGGVGNVFRSTTANITLERDWQVSLRGRVGYAFDRWLVYATGGLAATSMDTRSTFTFVTTLGAALTPFAAIPPQNFTAQGVGGHQDFLGVTAGFGFEYAATDNVSFAADYRYTDFGKRHFVLAKQPQAGPFGPATAVDSVLHLTSHQLTARANYHFGSPLASRQVAMAPPPAVNWGGCYLGGYAGAAWAHKSVDASDPTANQAVFSGPAVVQTPFFNPTAALAGGGVYSYDLSAGGIGGGTLGCNWQAPSSRFVWGVEAEGGAMRLRASVQNPFNFNDAGNDHVDATKVGDWYGAFTARMGYAVDDKLFYLKGGVGVTRIETASNDPCLGTGLVGDTSGCTARILTSSGSKTPAFFVVGGGAEWALTQNWTAKAEYLYLGIDENVAACGLGGSRTFTPTVINFCSDHHVGGIHTVKLGANYKLY